jgi:hypothetical protein
VRASARTVRLRSYPVAFPAYVRARFRPLGHVRADIRVDVGEGQKKLNEKPSKQTRRERERENGREQRKIEQPLR